MCATETERDASDGERETGLVSKPGIARLAGRRVKEMKEFISSSGRKTAIRHVKAKREIDSPCECTKDGIKIDTNLS